MLNRSCLNCPFYYIKVSKLKDPFPWVKLSCNLISVSSELDWGWLPVCSRVLWEQKLHWSPSIFRKGWRKCWWEWLYMQLRQYQEHLPTLSWRPLHHRLLSWCFHQHTEYHCFHIQGDEKQPHQPDSLRHRSCGPSTQFGVHSIQCPYVSSWWEY